MKKRDIGFLVLLLSCLPPFGSAATLLDPTRPPRAVLATLQREGNLPKPLMLTAVFIHPQYRLAIISGQAVKLGGTINGFTVTAITPYTVELLGPSNTKETLTLIEPVKRRRDRDGF